MGEHKVNAFLRHHGVPHITKVEECGSMTHHECRQQCVCGAMCYKQQLVRVNGFMYLMVATSCLKYLHNEESENGIGNIGERTGPEFAELDEDAYLLWCKELGKAYEEKLAKIERARREELEAKRIAAAEAAKLKAEQDEAKRIAAAEAAKLKAEQDEANRIAAVADAKLKAERERQLSREFDETQRRNRENWRILMQEESHRRSEYNADRFERSWI